MKNKLSIILAVSICLAALPGCKTDTIGLYSGDNYIQFEKNLVLESVTVVPFFLYPEEDELEVPVTVAMSGLAPVENSPYKLVVDTENSTAKENVHFRMPSDTFFAAGEYTSTAYITFIKTPDMKEEKFTLVVRVAENENYKVGQREYAFVELSVHDQITAPEWWTWSVTNLYLGDYSDRKYEHFLIATEARDLTPDTDMSVIRQYAIVFKYYLDAKKAAGETVYEANGNEMTVNVNN